MERRKGYLVDPTGFGSSIPNKNYYMIMMWNREVKNFVVEAVDEAFVSQNIYIQDSAYRVG